MKKFYGRQSRITVVGNARITANTVGQCAKLVNVAKKLGESAPTDVKAGPFHVRGCGMKNVLIGTGIMIGVAWVWKSIGRKRKNGGENAVTTLPKPEPSKMESLNETIGKNTDSLKEMRVVGDLIRYGGINLIFSPTGEGKSVLAMQLAIDMASGDGSLILPDEERQAGRPVFTIVYDEEKIKKISHQEIKRDIEDPKIPTSPYPDNSNCIIDITSAIRNGKEVVSLEVNRNHGKDCESTGESILTNSTQHTLLVLSKAMADSAGMKVVQFSNDKTQKGTTVFLDLKKSGNLKVTLSKSLGNGKYEREELLIPEPIIEKLRDTLNSNFSPATFMPAKQTAKAYSISDIRKKQGQNTYAPWTDAEDQELMEIFISVAKNDTLPDVTVPDPLTIASKWGVVPSDAASDIKKARNMFTAVKLFISKAVDDNWQSNQ